MARKLVVCCDGTWNDNDSNSNIFRTYQRLREEMSRPGEERDRSEGWRISRSGDAVLFYDDGVGSKFWDRAAGGITGVGLSRNVCQAYQFLCREYQHGDEIYIFGFSRGAYTARSLGGFIGAAGGLLPGASGSAIARAYLEEYVAGDNLLPAEGSGATAARAEIAAELGLRSQEGVQAHGQQRRPVTIRFMGVYDTVGSLGVPTPVLTRLLGPVVRFHDTGLGRHIEHAVHALAVDERRPPFAPTLWAMPEGRRMADGQTCLQVWFPGVHSDIGGGYADRGIADITFDFMMRQATERGLVIDAGRLAGAHPWSDGALAETPCQHNSFSAKWSLFSRLFEHSDDGVTRPIGHVQRLARDAGSMPAAGREMIHPCLVRRWRKPVETVFEDDRGSVARRESSPYEHPSFAWPDEVRQRRPGDVPVFAERIDGIRLSVDEATRLDGKPCRVLDRSPHGARVTTTGAVPVGARVRLGDLPAMVVWSTAGQAGLRL